MSWAVPYLVFLHVLGVIFAFGPTYSYSIFGSFLKDEPQHRDYFARARDKVSRQMTWPATLSLLVTGALIIIAGGYQVQNPSMRWLQLAIVLYLGMIFHIRFVLDPMNRRISAMGKAAREAAAARAAAASAGAAGAGAASAGGAAAPGGAAAGGAPGQGGAAAQNGAPVGGPPAGGPPGGGPGGPPPELMKLVNRTRRDGKILGIVVIVIVFLMVVKPAFPI
ncbi:MAG: DUF2269 family protein [Chloroflexota bacterium]